MAKFPNWLAHMWESLPEEDKAKFRKKNEEDKVRFEREMTIYRATQEQNSAPTTAVKTTIGQHGKIVTQKVALEEKKDEVKEPNCRGKGI